MRVTEPHGESFRQFAEGYPKDTPIVTMSLLKFKERAAYPDDSGWDKCGGREAYARYREVVRQKVNEAGGEVVWEGDVMASPIAPSDESWDEVVFIRYPTADAFLTVVTDTNYEANLIHRSAALEDSRLIAIQGKSS